MTGSDIVGRYVVVVLLVMELGLAASSASTTPQLSDTSPSRQHDPEKRSASGSVTSKSLAERSQENVTPRRSSFSRPPDHETNSASGSVTSKSLAERSQENVTPRSSIFSRPPDHETNSVSGSVTSKSFAERENVTPRSSIFSRPPDHKTNSVSGSVTSKSLAERENVTPRRSSFSRPPDHETNSVSGSVTSKSLAERSQENVTPRSSIFSRPPDHETNSASGSVTSKSLAERSQENVTPRSSIFSRPPDHETNSVSGSVTSKSLEEMLVETLEKATHDGGLSPPDPPSSEKPPALDLVPGEPLSGKGGAAPADTTPRRQVSPLEYAPANYTLTQPNGTIVWEHPAGRCVQPTKWSVQTPLGNGVVVELHQVVLSRAWVLTVASVITQSDQTITTEVERNITGGEMFSYAPMLLRGNVTMVLSGSGLLVKAIQNSSAYINYTVYPLASLPHRVPQSDRVLWSVDVYNCSTGCPVPEALRCDGVQHCFDDEDEADCEYRQHGCGYWLPYNNHCITLIIGEYAVQRAIADYVCKVYQSTMLRDLSRISLPANLIRKSGIHLAWINLQKVKPKSEKIKHLYRYLWQLGHAGSPIHYEATQIQRDGVLFDCAALAVSPDTHFKLVLCDVHMPKGTPIGAICMRPNPNKTATPRKNTQSVNLQTEAQINSRVPTKKCRDGSRVHLFHQCHWHGHFSDIGHTLTRGLSFNTSWSPNNFRLFQCNYGPPVHYSLVCDGLNDCVDGSDEQGCLRPDQSACTNHQFPPYSRRCNGFQDCFDGSDEQNCLTCYPDRTFVKYCIDVGCIPFSYEQWFPRCSGRPSPQYEGCEPCQPNNSVVHLDGHGMSTLTPLSNINTTRSSALEGLFRCDNGMYIPSFLLRNGEKDCLDGEDETIPAENITCPGFYRCQYYGNCVHPDLVCDGVNHCPLFDDERHCDFANFKKFGMNIASCTCEGLACLCHNISSWSYGYGQFVPLRYLDVSGNDQIHLTEISEIYISLQFFNASFCRVSNVSLGIMQQLKVLDLSFNDLRSLSSLVLGKLPQLTHLNISGNPLVSTLDSAFTAFLTKTGLINLQDLVMVNTGISEIVDNALSVLTHLITLDIRDNEIETHGTGVFEGLVNLRMLKTDDFKLCCPFVLPKMSECEAPEDELSSCSDLLRLDIFRVCLWVISVLVVVGNAGVLVYAVIRSQETLAPSYRLLVANLAAADFLMGIYMTIIGSADAHFHGVYVVHEAEWRQSGTCITAGFLAFVSSEVSAFIICLITLDRFLKVCFPFKFQLHIEPRSCVVMCCVAWLCGLCLAAVPLIAQLQFYGVSGICLPLPITRHSFSGHGYSFGVFVMMNFILFVLIGAGQAAIYRAIRASAKSAGSKRQQRDTTIARRLFLVVLTDFCCWFPIGVMGIMAFYGIPIPLQVNALVAIFVMPLNSALNPFLYTVNRLVDKRAKKKTQERTKKILANLQVEVPKLPDSTVEALIVSCLRSRKAIVIEILSRSLDRQAEAAATTSLADNVGRATTSYSQGSRSEGSAVECETQHL